MTAEEYFDRGYSRINETKNYSGAISDFTKVIELGYSIGTAYMNRGVAKVNLEDYYGAIEDFNKTLELDPNYAIAYANRGASKENLGDLNGACADWREAARLGDEDAPEWVRDQCGGVSSSSMTAEEYLKRGVEEWTERNYIEAIDEFTKAIEIGSKNDNTTIYTSYFYRANSKAFLGDFAGALKDIELAKQNGWPLRIEGYQRRWRKNKL